MKKKGNSRKYRSHTFVWCGMEKGDVHLQKKKRKWNIQDKKLVQALSFLLFFQPSIEARPPEGHANHRFLQCTRIVIVHRFLPEYQL